MQGSWHARQLLREASSCAYAPLLALLAQLAALADAVTRLRENQNRVAKAAAARRAADQLRLTAAHVRRRP